MGSDPITKLRLSATANDNYRDRSSSPDQNCRGRGDPERGSSAYGIRTRATAVRGRRPRPLDECAEVLQRAAAVYRLRSQRVQVTRCWGRRLGQSCPEGMVLISGFHEAAMPDVLIDARWSVTHRVA